MPTPLDILKQYWNYDSFRDSQEEVISAVLEGKDTLALLPTGGGKSICFQVPTLVKEGLCIVISPLLALMADQVDSLTKRGIKAVAINSMLKYRDIDRLLDNCIYGDIRFLFISPERIENPLFQERLQKMKPTLIAVDEAHCISQWGYDFRPAYLTIAQIREIHPTVPMLALTATATPDVVDDIQEKLLFKQKHVISRSFNRTNISFNTWSVGDKRGRVLDLFKAMPSGSGILYVRNRRLCRELSDMLAQNGLSSTYYHAGMSKQNRAAQQALWISGEKKIMVSTNAFGMGIDKADVRLVIHFDLSDCIESYYQEAGRAGRDGLPSAATQLYTLSDTQDALTRIESQFPELSTVKKVYQALADRFQLATGSVSEESFGLSIGEFSERLGLRLFPTYGALKLLELNGYIILSEGLSSPSKLQMSCSRRELEDLMDRNASMKRFLDVLLRSYTGLFTSPVSISEIELASRLKIPEKLVVELLQRLENMTLATYLKKSSAATISFPMVRVPAQDIRLSKETNAGRRERMIGKQQAMIHYAENIYECRIKLLLAYFGEENTSACGQCDVCLQEKSLGLNSQEYVTLLRQIRSRLLPGKVDLETLHQEIEGDSERTRALIRWLMDNDFIRSFGKVVSWNVDKERIQAK